MSSRALRFLFISLALSSCASKPDYEKISGQYADCGSNKIHIVELTSHGWYQSWYVNCGGKEFFCRYDKNNTHGWNGCRPTKNGM